jgi:hypothetical protein
MTIIEINNIPGVASGYLKAAAVLSYFDPQQLKPVGEPGSLQELLTESTIVYDRDSRPRWTLHNEVRKQILRILGDREAMRAALEANPVRPDDTLQKMLEAYIQEQAPPLPEQDLDQLSSTLQVVEWMGGILDGLPDRATVRVRMDWASFLKPFRSLADEHFRGRQSELRELREYVGVLEPSSISASIRRQVREIFSLNERAPLLIYGPGGTGKSTLLAKFILEHAELDESLRFPFAYLDFDRPGLLAEEPLTLLAEVVRQLGTQYSEKKDYCLELREEMLREISPPSSKDAGEALRPQGVNTPSEKIQNRFLSEFQNLLHQIGVQEKPVLLVLDTFEEVQFRSQNYVIGLWSFLNRLQEQVPKLRVVLAGRARVKNIKTVDVHLSELDPPAAAALLLSYGVTDEAVSAKVVKQVGGNPLSLKLAGELLRKEGPRSEGIPGLETNWYLWRLQDQMLQGLLYQRILGHIQDDDIRKLAHPGLILRRITPPLLRDVLAEPCGVSVPDAKRAEELFRRMRQEVALLAPSEDGSLHHRPDLRHVMLKLLRNDQPTKVEDIQRRAVAFYKMQPGVVARAEEIYHRLSLGEDPETITERWMDGVEQYLQSSIGDLPARAQTYLASRIGFEIDQETWNKASREDLERQAVRRVNELLGHKHYGPALELLHERIERSPASPLYTLEATTYSRMHRFEDARNAIREGLASASQVPHATEALNLAILSAQLDVRLGQSEPPTQVLQEYRLFAEHFRADHRLLVLGLHRLTSLRSTRPPCPEAIRSLKLEMLSVLEEIPESDVKSHPSLYRRVAAELGDESSALPPRLLHYVGLEKTLSPRMLSELAGFLVEWDSMISPPSGVHRPGVLAQAVGLEVPSTQQDWDSFLKKIGGDRAFSVIGALLEKYTIPQDVFPVLARIMRAGYEKTSSPIEF